MNKSNTKKTYNEQIKYKKTYNEQVKYKKNI